MSNGVVASNPALIDARDGDRRPLSLDATGALRTTGPGAGGADPGSTPNGYQQIPNVAASTALTVPAGSTVAVVIPDGAGVRMRKDGVAPTASVGMPIPVGGFVKLYGPEIAAARFIQVAASAVLNVEYGK